MIYAIGLGLDIRAHLSNEAKVAIKSCRLLYLLSPDLAAINIIKQINPTASIVDCSEYYDAESHRPKVYSNIAADILNESDEYTNIGIAVYGNPMFLVSAVEKIIHQAAKKNIDTKVIPAISSFDSVLADLKLDLGYGVTVIDASLLLSGDYKIDTKLPLLIFQIANIGSKRVEKDKIGLDRIKPLVKFLLKEYPKDHKCKFVVSEKSPFDLGYVVETKLSEIMSSETINLTHRPTMYIPEVNV